MARCLHDVRSSRGGVRVLRDSELLRNCLQLRDLELHPATLITPR